MVVHRRKAAPLAGAGVVIKCSLVDSDRGSSDPLSQLFAGGYSTSHDYEDRNCHYYRPFGSVVRRKDP